ncbi:MAG: hypothetical protein ACOYKZ_07370 [Chlamydiia bacterium]
MSNGLSSIGQQGLAMVPTYSTESCMARNLAIVPVRIVCGMALSVIRPLAWVCQLVSDREAAMKSLKETISALFTLNFLLSIASSTAGTMLARAVILSSSGAVGLCLLSLLGAGVLCAIVMSQAGSNQKSLEIAMGALESFVLGLVIGAFLARRFKAAHQPRIDEATAAAGPIPKPTATFVNQTGDVVFEFDGPGMMRTHPELIPGVREEFYRLNPWSERAPTVGTVYWRSPQQWWVSIETWKERWTPKVITTTAQQPSGPVTSTVVEMQHDWVGTSHAVARGADFSVWAKWPEGWFRTATATCAIQMGLQEKTA